ncbi:hypothetical protein [Providencia phage PSTCR6]|nr:hypothetical protein [Providencia phage PSTCR6]
MNLDFSTDFSEKELNYINSLSGEELDKLAAQCSGYITMCNTNQINRKLLINSLYGAFL